MKTIYSVPRLSQKEFGIFSNRRKWLANKIANSALKDREMFDKTVGALKDTKTVNLGKKRRKALYQVSKKHKVGVVKLPGDSESRYMPNQLDFPKNIERIKFGNT